MIDACSFLTDLTADSKAPQLSGNGELPSSSASPDNQPPFPPGDDHALAMFCDNEKIQADGYLECERLCLVAECCWKEDSEEPCSGKYEDECELYAQHCYVLNDPEIIFET